MFKIRTLNKISKTGLNELGAGYAVSDDEASPEAIILRSFKMHEMELPESLLCVARAGAGTNNIPIDKCTEKGIVVFNTPGANANAVKELVIAGLLLSARKIYQGINWAQGLQGQDDVAGLVEKGKANFGGIETMGKTIGVVGIGGAIGTLTANACHALGMKVIGSDPFLSDKAKAALHPDIKAVKADSPEGYLGECDYISIHAPYTPGTKHMFNAASLGKCKKGAVIINAARGELVDDAAMISALESGQIGCYVTDFPNGTLLGNEKIITIPHLGASSEEAEENCAYMAAVQTREFLEKGNIVNSVNFPSVASGKEGPLRSSILFGGDNAEKTAERIKEIIGERNKGFEIISAVKGTAGYLLCVYETDSCNGACDIIRAMPEVCIARSIR
jgi:D-3-phosphoglycerate dehydrogenase